jgi:hypothetical protein
MADLQVQRQPLNSLTRPSSWYYGSLSTKKDERWAFEFYFERVAPSIAGMLDLPFWRGIIIHMCRSEPAIWDAIIALSSLYYDKSESKDDFIPLFTDDSVYGGKDTVRSTQAIEWYARSLSNIRSQIKSATINTQVALVSCILFTCFEALYGNPTQAYELYCQGSALIYSLHSPAAKPSAQIIAESTFASNILPIFIRQGMTTFLFGGNPRSLRIQHGTWSDSHQFESMGDCRIALYRLMEDCFSFANHRPQELRSDPSSSDETTGSADALSKQTDLLTRLQNWLSAFMSSKTILQADGKELLLMLQGTTYIITATCLSHQESIYDEHIDRFETILQHALDLLSKASKSSNGFPIQSFEMGGGLCLYHIVIKCRDLRLRRRALELFGKVPRVHAFHGIVPGAMLGAKVIELEEEKEAGSSKCGDGENGHDCVPVLPGYPIESRRIKGIYLNQERQNDGSVNICLHFSRNKWDPSLLRWYPVKTVLPVYQGSSAAESQQLLFNLGKECIGKVLGSSFSQS